jgi:Fe-S cluster biogenesis protein NfuA
MTMKLGIEEGIRNEVPEVKDVVAINQQQQTQQ